MKSVVLLTGGSGLLALNWAIAMRDRHSVILALHERMVTLAGVESRVIDLGSVDEILSCLDKTEAALVVHTAGLTSVEACEADPVLAEYVNVTLAGNVAQACAERGVTLAHISTDHLFSGQGSFADETRPPDPQNAYGKTKARAEEEVTELCEHALLVRTNFYGWGTSYRRSFSDAIISSLRRGESFSLFRDVFFTPILVEMLAQAVHDLVDAGGTGIFNVVGDERLSKLEFGQRIARHFQLDANLIRSGVLTDRPELVRRPHEMSLSNRKASELLGRKLGGVDNHLARLFEQEQRQVARDLGAL